MYLLAKWWQWLLFKQEWTLHLRSAQERDSGDYSCQISSHPPLGIIATINVVSKLSKILTFLSSFYMTRFFLTFCNHNILSVPRNCTQYCNAEPMPVIKGGPDIYVESGSDVELLCSLKNFTEPLNYVFWYHNNQMINYNSTRKVSVAFLCFIMILVIQKEILVLKIMF